VAVTVVVVRVMGTADHRHWSLMVRKYPTLMRVAATVIERSVSLETVRSYAVKRRPTSTTRSTTRRITTTPNY
jgi:hypothetical protein